MVMDLLGPSLEDLFNYCGKKFSLKTVCMLMVQLVKRFQRIHMHRFIHRDIKPENFLVGLNNKSAIVHVVDFGLAKRYFSSTEQKHIPYRKDKGLVGTARYASIHAHLGEELSRRDDFEALGNVMIYFYKGLLPWQNLYGVTNSDKYRKIKEVKCGTQLNQLCEGCPDQFLQYMLHCRSLQFEEQPNYEMLSDLFKQIAIKEGFDLQDEEFDWALKHSHI